MVRTKTMPSFPDPDFPEPHLDPEDHPDFDKMLKEDKERLVARFDRIWKIHEFEKSINEELKEEAQKPLWVKEAEYGDYHYNSWDLEPAESEEE